MSQRRMFSPDIVSSEEFLTMPVSSRELYFQLGMNADDDGFVQPKIIMRLIGANDDDLKILIAKRFLLIFENGVVVIKHWLIHNMIRADRYKPTRFQKEKEVLKIKENKAYTESKQLGCQDDNQSAPQVRLGKVRLGKDRLVNEQSATAENKTPSNKKTPETKKNPLEEKEISIGSQINKIVAVFQEDNPLVRFGNKTDIASIGLLINKYSFNEVLEVAKHSVAIRGTDKFLGNLGKITKPSEFCPNYLKIKDIKYPNKKIYDGEASATNEVFRKISTKIG